MHPYLPWELLKLQFLQVDEVRLVRQHVERIQTAPSAKHTSAPTLQPTQVSPQTTAHTFLRTSTHNGMHHFALRFQLGSNSSPRLHITYKTGARKERRAGTHCWAMPSPARPSQVRGIAAPPKPGRTWQHSDVSTRETTSTQMNEARIPTERCTHALSEM